MTSSITVKDVAQAASVSVVTVSRVFNNHVNVTEETRQRVFKAAAEIGYFGLRASANTKQRQGTLREIGFFFEMGVDTIASGPFWSHIIFGVEERARKTNIKLICRSISDLVPETSVLLSTIQDLGVDGILLVGQPEPKFVHLVQSIPLPVVLVDTDIPGHPVDAVLSDYFGGAKQAVEYLIGEGHTRIALISPPPVNPIYTVGLRVAGYRTALMNAGLMLDEQLCSWSSDNLGVDGGYEACQNLLNSHVPFSSIFCLTDEMAIGAIKALHGAGLRVPDDVSIVGFDDIDMAAHFTPALTTIRVNKEEMGATAVKALIARAADPDAVATTTTLKVELIKRGSVLPHSS